MTLDPRAVAHTLGGSASGLKVIAPGPGHSRADRSLSIQIDPAAPDGFRLHSFASDDWRECRDYVRRRLGLAPWEGRRGQSSRGQSQHRAAAPDDDSGGSAFALRLWNEAIDPRNTIVTDYLASRGLSLPKDVTSDVIRYHPALKLDGAPIGGMVALLRDIRSNQQCGIHRTFLDKTGRAFLDGNDRKIRKMLGRAGGAAVKLAADEAVSLGLGIVEGVEDGLAVMLSGWQPIWVATTAGTIKRFPVLAGIEALTIFADADATGMAAAEECAARWVEAGKEARICSPQVKGPARDCRDP
jgi:putative DNA primase/helicase